MSKETLEHVIRAVVILGYAGLFALSWSIRGIDASDRQSAWEVLVIHQLGVQAAAFFFATVYANLDLARRDHEISTSHRLRTIVMYGASGAIAALCIGWWAVVFTDPGGMFTNYDGSSDWTEIIMGFLVFCGLNSTPWVIAFMIARAVRVYIPGALVKQNIDNEEDMRWMMREESFSKLERLELARHLAGRGPESVAAALNFEVEDPERLERATARLLDELSARQAIQALDLCFDRMPDDSRRYFLRRWTEHARADELLPGLTKSLLMHEVEWASPVLEVANSSKRPGAHHAAFTILSAGSRITEHTAAFEYLSEFGPPLLLPRIKELRAKFSMIPGFKEKLEALEGQILSRHGVEAGALSLSESGDAAGGLSVAREGGGLEEVRGDDER